MSSKIGVNQSRESILTSLFEFRLRVLARTRIWAFKDGEIDERRRYKSWRNEIICVNIRVAYDIDLFRSEL